MPRKTTSSKAAAAATKAPAQRLPSISKSDFVRSQPNMPASEVVRRGKEQGLKITESLVYNVRAADKKKVVGKDVPASQHATRASAAVESPLLERQFRTVVVRLGLDRSEELLALIRTDLTPMDPPPAKRKSNGTAPVSPSHSISSGASAVSTSSDTAKQSTPTT